MVWFDYSTVAVGIPQNGPVRALRTTATVTDAETGLPVSLMQDGNPVASLTTDADGRLDFQAEDASVVRVVMLGQDVLVESEQQKIEKAVLAADLQETVDNALDVRVLAGDIATPAMLAGKVAKGELVVNVRDYGAVGDGVADDTAALRAAFSVAGAARFILPRGTYKVTPAEGTSLATFTNRAGVTIEAAEAIISNPTSYTADTLTPMFIVDGGSDFRLTLREYVGYTLPTPATHLGYRGATLVRAVNGANGIFVDATITNARYGVQSGEYGDATKGGCRNFDVRLRGAMVGYPLALYLASGVRHDLDFNGIHRVAYIAGCDDVRGVARWRDQYIAPTAYLLTDALAAGTDAAAQANPGGAPTTSRGCSNVDITSIDKGSTVFQTSSVCAGITLSRVDPCRFENINVRVYTVGTDTVSTRVGGFMLLSNGVPAIWSRYPYDWEQHVVLDNITVSGVVDHSAQTLPSNALGELYVYTKDDAGEATGHYATVRRLAVDGLTVLKSSSGTQRDLFLVAREPQVPIRVRSLLAPGVTLLLVTSATVPTILEGCSLLRVSSFSPGSGSLVSVGDGCTITSRQGAAPYRVHGPAVGGAGASIMQKETTLTLTGASTTWTAAIPQGALLLGVQGRVQVAVTGATGYQVGVSGDVGRFVNTNTLTAASTFGPASQAATEVSPRWYAVNTDLIVTAKTSNFTGGQLRLVLTYLAFNAPTA